MPGFIEQDQWKRFLEDFTKRNKSRATRLEVVGEGGAQEEEAFLPLVGVTFEPRGTAAGSVEIILGGETSEDDRHLEHVVEKVQRIAPLLGAKSFEDGLGLEDEEGSKTLLIFQSLPEIPDRTSDTRQRSAM